uniref:Uncharacterized protein n=1 Tax=Globisporangium ultimum (strain ATCC 200006 / CBS 805.95 / DAOM BR144) TaxID=431595 RepID=K3XA92_GLOUD
MTEAIVWKYSTERDLARLAERHTLDECRRQRNFTHRQTSVLLGICQSLMDRDFCVDSSSNLNSSFSHFQTLLLTHSVQRSPKSVGIFSVQEVAAIVDFVTHTYFRHFHLYKGIYTPYYHTHIVQKAVNGVQVPQQPRPLADAILHLESPFVAPPLPAAAETGGVAE